MKNSTTYRTSNDKAFQHLRHLKKPSGIAKNMISILLLLFMIGAPFLIQSANASLAPGPQCHGLNPSHFLHHDIYEK